ncbi:MAG: S9 family peptidase, partial [Chitinophagales bacterium]
MKYPATRQIKQIDDYHGTPINDPYRWLEDDTASEVKQWVTAQNEVTQSYLNQIPYREQIKARYTTLFNYLKLNVSQKVGEYYIFYKNEGLQNQSTIYIKEGLQGEESILIDPNTLSEDGTVTINILEASLDNRYVTYAKAEAGSDWQEIYILDLHTRQTLPDCLKWIKFTDISWTENGFYYSRYPAPEQGKEFSNANKHHTVHFHELGTAQSDDQLVYENRTAPLQYHYANVTEDGKYLILYAATGTDGYECYYKDLTTDGKEFTALFTGFKHKNTVIDHHEGRFLVRTDIDAPKYRLVSIDPLAPNPDNWITVLPEQADLLQQVTIAGGKL